MSVSWESTSAASPASAAGSSQGVAGGGEWLARARARALAARRTRPELGALIVLAAVLNLWALGRNGWANDYYSAAVRSMSSSWHNFLFASLDRSGVMTVDKPPLALWVQSLSVRVFGYHPLSMLVPQALMGVASVALVYDLVRRRFGRVGGFVAGLALALTPITVAISRHNNPDALLVLCCVAALWCALRALDDGRTRWLVLAGLLVGLGFETKMAVALTVVPGIALAWLLVAPRGRVRALRQLLAGAAAMLLAGGAWPALVALTPASDRPWISGTSDNSIFSLIFGYNGLGRVDGQAGGPGGLGGGSVFGGSPGPLRLLNAALGGQAGWLLGFALLSGLGVLLATRLRRSDARTGWLIAVGGAFLTTAVLFSAASGIFHPVLRLAARAVRRGARRRRCGPAARRRARHAHLRSTRARRRRRLRARRPASVPRPAWLAGAGPDRALPARKRRAGGSHRRADPRGRRCDGDRRAAARPFGLGRRHARARDQRHLPRRRTGQRAGPGRRGHVRSGARACAASRRRQG